MIELQQNSTAKKVPVQCSSGSTLVTSTTPSLKIAINGAAPASVTGTVAAPDASGVAWYTPSSADLATLGLGVIEVSGTGIDAYNIAICVRPWDPWGVLPTASAGFGCGFPAIDAQYSVTISRPQFQNIAKTAYGAQYHNVWFVDPANGNDTFSGLTPISAVSDGPFATINKAISVAGSGDLILLSAGTHTPSGACKFPDGVSCRGQGIDVTFIDGHTLSIAGNGCIVRPGGSARFSDCTILGDTTIGNFTAPIGYDCGSQSPPQNCIVERVKTVGWSDGIYIKAKSGDTCSIRFRDCIFASGYDTLNAIPNSAADIGTINLELENCQFLGNGPVGRTDPVRCVCHEANGLIRMWGGRIDATHAGTGGVYGVITVAQAGNTNNPTIRCYGVEIYTTGGASHNDFANGIGTITETDCTYDPTTISGTVTQRQPSLPSLPTGWITASGIAAAALNGKGDWSTYAGGDTAGTTTLLSRLTATRAGNLDNLDASVNSRLASASYTAPDNADIAVLVSRLTATRAGNLDNLDAAVSSRLATTSYVAPDNADIVAAVSDLVSLLARTDPTTALTAIKSVTDGLSTMLTPSGPNKTFTPDALKNAPAGGGSGVTRNINIIDRRISAESL